MKLQYRYDEGRCHHYTISLYHDGELVKTYKTTIIDLADEIEKLEEQGYSYGYTKGEVEAVKRKYEVMLKNVI